jgi:Leishmanolysin
MQPSRHVLISGKDADVIIYVTSQPRDSCGSTLASAAACAFDPATHRPVAGNIIFCKIDPQSFDQDLATAVHELMHVLARAPALPACSESQRCGAALRLEGALRCCSRYSSGYLHTSGFFDVLAPVRATL